LEDEVNAAIDSAISGGATEEVLDDSDSRMAKDPHKF
jgi:D-aminopeptidase